jgi:hypothetical protein
MRSRVTTVVGISAAALALGFAFAPMASASHGVGAAHRTPAGQLVHHAKTAAACVSQRDNDNGIGIVSQNFEATFDAYDAQGADDFKIGATACKVKTVTVDGAYFNGAGPADSFNVTFYKGKTTPGTVVKSLTKGYTDNDGIGGVTVKLGRKGPKLAKGHYWVSVQANLSFSVGGEWGWNTNNTVRGQASQWQNPGNGFATGCTTYTTTTTCIPSGEGGDNSFQLN